MKCLRLASAFGLVLAGGLILGACADEPYSPNAAEDAEADASARLLAHSPTHHGPQAPHSLAVTSTPAYTDLEAASARGTRGSIHLGVSTSGTIPRHPDAFITSVAVFGYAWADLDAGRGIVAVIHPTIGRDSRQNPDGWHTHPVELTTGTKPSGTSDFCIVSIGRSQGGIAINGDRLRVHMSHRWAGISAGALDVAASFVVQGDAGCTATGLGVVILDAETL